MEQKIMICYGDSNTYGYDARNPLGSPYGPEDRWVDLLAEKTGWKLLNLGVNGRTIPQHGWEFDGLERAVDKYENVDYVTILLGTNDILVYRNSEASVIAQGMEKLLDHLEKISPKSKVILLTPTPLNLPEYPKTVEKLDEVCDLYAEIAKRRGLLFCDTRPWNLPLAHDGVHLSREGQHVLAEKFYSEFISKL